MLLYTAFSEFEFDQLAGAFGISETVVLNKSIDSLCGVLVVS